LVHKQFEIISELARKVVWMSSCHRPETYKVALREFLYCFSLTHSQLLHVLLHNSLEFYRNVEACFKIRKSPNKYIKLGKAKPVPQSPAFPLDLEKLLTVQTQEELLDEDDDNHLIDALQ